MENYRTPSYLKLRNKGNSQYETKNKGNKKHVRNKIWEKDCGWQAVKKMALQSEDLLKREYFLLTNDNNDYYKCGVAA